MSSSLKKLPAQFERVEVNWEDSVKDQGSWCNITEYDFDSHYRSMQYKTIGYFLIKKENSFFVAQSFREDGDISGVMGIPYSAIKSIRVIKD